MFCKANPVSLACPILFRKYDLNLRNLVNYRLNVAFVIDNKAKIV